MGGPSVSGLLQGRFSLAWLETGRAVFPGLPIGRPAVTRLSIPGLIGGRAALGGPSVCGLSEGRFPVSGPPGAGFKGR